jgi:hypothetical protein
MIFVNSSMENYEGVDALSPSTLKSLVQAQRGFKGVPIGKKIHTQRGHWPSVRLREEFVHPARRWWPSTEPPMGSFLAFIAASGAQAPEGTGTAFSDCVLGSTARDISGSNPSRSATN